jgi:hypothetical protein
MERRRFLGLSGAGLIDRAAGVREDVPAYRVVTRHKPWPQPGMPGPYPGRVVRVRSPRSIDERSNRADDAVVREMLDRGMRALFGARDAREAWRKLFGPDDLVGIKVNCSGHPGIVSAPEIVGHVVRSLIAAGVRPERIVLYERFADHLADGGYDPHLPAGVGRHGAEEIRGVNGGYDPFTYVDVDFFGEDDTRSNLTRVVSERFTKIINIPNMKDHGAAGVTGCLKNIAYGSFSNVARSHTFTDGRSHTFSFVGTLAAVEPLRSRTVLQIMDGLRGVWHGGPFLTDKRYLFHPKQIWLGTDPVAIDRLLVDVIDDKRRAMGARSIHDRSPASLGSHEARNRDPNVNILIREPGHVDFAARLGLGVADKARIRAEDVEV